MAISKKEVEHVANLARLNLTDEEKETFTKQLDAILEFANKLNELDTEYVEPTSHVLPISNVLREDEDRPSLPVEDVIKNAPDHEDGLIKVPAVLESE
ncbi:Asp-tRNA(Asn)/Glu-tRNA(Gln) amidotransferase subunit GatC [Microaerobacter geothermalis]|uniref:Asp-tRNA(Asn)/Glu-tRNA(Gln) amidotransferase subunit GatC n=1 Tax=Microaerobacter geothermalis TaxID=674972 RepID=UPI001F3ECD85|nr:Asp-tRNA(Asn)/Glu-tRNA(Gln) amidotransferase subunit GatC [Microaerobacter geothermalis]MCF6093973.1 Asp-tRNA(Asn)/Glu-tRNA(Gln) amidotransferase subunit GatC [Microaerobacter geothermalis]